MVGSGVRSGPFSRHCTTFKDLAPGFARRCRQVDAALLDQASKLQAYTLHRKRVIGEACCWMLVVAAPLAWAGIKAAMQMCIRWDKYVRQAACEREGSTATLRAAFAGVCASANSRPLMAEAMRRNLTRSAIR